MAEIIYTKSTNPTKGNSYEYTFTGDNGAIVTDIAHYPENFSEAECEAALEVLKNELNTSPFILPVPVEPTPVPTETPHL